MIWPEYSLPPDPPGRKLLVLNATGEVAQMLLADSNGRAWELLDFLEFSRDASLMEAFFPAIGALFARHGVSGDNLSGLACVRGPGRFTGIRIALAAALGLARATGSLLAGLDLLPLIACGARPLLKRGNLLVVADRARRGQVYAQTFFCEPAGMKAIAPAVAATTDDFIKTLHGLTPPVAVVGNAPRLCFERNEEFAELSSTLHILPEEYNLPRPEALLHCAARAAYGQAPVEPLYLRLSDAEANLDSIAAGRGLDPVEARLRLSAAMKAEENL